MELDYNTWTHPGTGEERRYINNWGELVGIEIDRYKTGNISSAALDDQHISNKLAGETLSAKVWFDSEGVIYVQRRGGRTAIADSEIINRLRPHVDATIAEIAEIAAKKQAEIEAEKSIPAGTTVVTEELEKGGFHGKYNTGSEILHITVKNGKRSQIISVYETEIHRTIYRTPITCSTNHQWHEGEALQREIRNLVESKLGK